MLIGLAIGICGTRVKFTNARCGARVRPDKIPAPARGVALALLGALGDNSWRQFLDKAIRPGKRFGLRPWLRLAGRQG